MAPIRSSIEIARPPEAVFDYVADVARRSDWQKTVQSVEVVDGDGGVGTRVRETRYIRGGPRAFTLEVTEHERPRRWGFRGVGNPVNAVSQMTFAPLDGGARTRVDWQIDFEGRGIGKLMALMARRGARIELPRDLEQLRGRLEAG
jgi:uncharacterized protein YndB with AHSA1/START domain